eukprot:SAG22_NODE_14851_length_363_cov_0.780303_2_plen_54_part_01
MSFMHHHDRCRNLWKGTIVRAGGARATIRLRSFCHLMSVATKGLDCIDDIGAML